MIFPENSRPGKLLRAHYRALAHGHAPQIAFGNIDDRPHHPVIGNPEQNVARLGTHAFGDVAFQNDAVARRGPFDPDRNVAAFLDGGDGRFGHVEIHQPLARALAVGPLAAAGDLGIERRDVFGGRRRDRRTVDFHQRLPLDDMRAGGDVGDLLDIAFGAHRDHGDAALVELNGAGGADRRADHAPGGRLRFDAGTLDLARRQLDRSVVAVLAFIDGDVIHPHRILLGRRRNIRQAHRIAVIFDLAIGRRRSRHFRRIVETYVGARRDGAVVTAIRRLLRRQRIERLAVRILIVDRSSSRFGARLLHDVCVLRLSARPEIWTREDASDRRSRDGSGNFNQN